MLSRVALLLALVLSAQAKDLTFWDPATSLTKGENIEVTKKAGGAIHGKLINATADAISVQTKKGEVTIPRPKIATVSTKRKASAASPSESSPPPPHRGDAPHVATFRRGRARFISSC